MCVGGNRFVAIGTGVCGVVTARNAKRNETTSQPSDTTSHTTENLKETHTCLNDAFTTYNRQKCYELLRDQGLKNAYRVRWMVREEHEIGRF